MDIGGQAVIQGIMMRNKEKFSVAVRLPNGKIKIKTERSTYFPKFFNVFFVRGMVGLMYTLYDGIRALIWSSNQHADKHEKLSKKEIIGTIFVSFLASIIFFIGLPFLAAHLINSGDFWFDILDGIFRVLLFIGYLLAISRIEDVKTLFQYHGAEHKSIFCYEQGKELTVKNVKDCSRFHPRCGTTFLFVLILLSIFIFTLIPGAWWMKLLGRIVLLPIISGIGYEIIKFAGKYSNNVIMKTLIAPGLWLQRITTKEPTDEQLEVGIASLKAVLN
ncbi:MAG: DUF1385 domain-containing protein [archaeon]|nr:DUF1385 domain-containing protein [archaeon]